MLEGVGEWEALMLSSAQQDAADWRGQSGELGQSRTL